MRGFGFLLLILLVGLVFWQYNSPDASKEAIDKGLDVIKGQIGDFDGFDNTSCSQNKVCFNGINYDSECQAIEYGISNYTMGECQ